jgi:hypothetical protein
VFLLEAITQRARACRCGQHRPQLRADLIEPVAVSCVHVDQDGSSLRWSRLDAASARQYSVHDGHDLAAAPVYTATLCAGRGCCGAMHDPCDSVRVPLRR